MKERVGLRCLVAVLLATATAFGAEPDTVHLTNGGRVRGMVVTDEPGGVTIQLPDGTTRTIARAEVMRIDYAAEAPPQQPPPPPPPRRRARRSEESERESEPEPEPPPEPAHRLYGFIGSGIVGLELEGAWFDRVDLSIDAGAYDVIPLTPTLSVVPRLTLITSTGIGSSRDGDSGFARQYFGTASGTVRFNVKRVLFAGAGLFAGVGSHVGESAAMLGPMIEVGVRLKDIELRVGHEIGAFWGSKMVDDNGRGFVPMSISTDISHHSLSFAYSFASF